MKQRPRKIVPPNPELDELIAKSCWSCYDGCCCGKDKNHEGLHECGSPTCNETWTTEQEKEWFAKMKAEHSK
jgi:hypothetical protein